MDLLKSENKQKRFWDFVKSLKNVRMTFNKILMSKFRVLPRNLKRNASVLKLFNETALYIKDLDDSGKGGPESADHHVRAGDDFGNKDEHMFEDFM